MLTTDWDTYVTGTTHLENNQWNEPALFVQNLRSISKACARVQEISIAINGNERI